MLGARPGLCSGWDNVVGVEVGWEVALLCAGAEKTHCDGRVLGELPWIVASAAGTIDPSAVGLVVLGIDGRCCRLRIVLVGGVVSLPA